MGYFGKAFVFTAEPAWDALNKLDPTVLLRGFRNKQAPLWLLDVATPSLRPGAGDPSPFTKRAGQDFEAELPSSTRDAVDLINQISNLAQLDPLYVYGPGWLSLTYRIASLVGVPTFFIVGDDEFYDGAWTITPTGEIPSLGIQLDDLLVTKGPEGWAIAVIPSEGADDAELEATQRRTDALRTSTGLTVTTPEDDPRSFSFFFFPNTLWPSDAPLPPAEALGLDWNLFSRFDGQYDEEFRRPPGTRPGTAI